MLQIKETYVDRDKNVMYGETGWYEPFTDDKSALYKSLRKEYGGTVHKVYRDELQINGTMAAVHCGWTFSKKVRYDDCNKQYTRQVWVSLREEE